MTHSAPIAYRPDIDGLRAVAVLSVVAYHAFPEYVSGGFIGVDVFFVISGFLISGIIYKNVGRGRFSLAEFYGRRIRRIFPALMVVLAACLTAGWFVLLPGEYEQLGKHTAAGAGFVANVVLWLEAGYFDTQAELKPLLHLWSLGVEEQFYLVWPLIACLIWSRTRSAIWTVAIVAISFTYDVSIVSRDPAGAFFLPMTRFWELLGGGLLAHWNLTRTASVSQSALQPHLRHAAAALGLLLIVLATVMIDRHTAFPSWWTLLPTGGAALAIAAGPDTWVNRRVLSQRGIVYVGLISYPLYLWHWPLLTFARILESKALGVGLRIGAVALSALLSALTFRWVERPLRTTARTALVTTCLCVAMSGVAIAGLVVKQAHGVPARIRQQPNDLDVRRWTYELPGTTACTFSSLPSTFCQTTVEPKVAIVGDSHAGHLFPGFIGSRHPFYSRAMVIGRGGCQPTLEAEALPGCDSQLRAALQLIKRTRSVELVVFSSFYNFLPGLSQEDQELFMTGYEKSFAAVREMGKRPLLFIDTPTLTFDPETCVAGTRPVTLTAGDMPPECHEYKKKGRPEYDTFMKTLTTRVPDLPTYDPASLFCRTDDVCTAFLGGLLQYTDHDHLSIYGSRTVVDDFIAKHPR